MILLNKNCLYGHKAYIALKNRIFRSDTGLISLGSYEINITPSVKILDSGGGIGLGSYEINMHTRTKK